MSVQAIDVGPIKKVRIGHESNNGISWWYVNTVSIYVPVHDTRVRFIANRDLGGDGTLDMDLLPGNEGELTGYKICLLTNDVPDEKKNAHAYMNLYGSKGNTGKLPIKTIKEDTENCYKVNAIDVGDISHIRIGHELNADFTSWFLCSVDVKKSGGSKVFFPVHQNLGTKGDDWAFNLELFPQEIDYEGEVLVEEYIQPPVIKQDYKVTYDLLLVTGQVPNACAKFNAYIILCGKRGFTGKIPLKDIKERSKNLFSLEAENIGELTKIRIGHDATANFSCWYLDKVSVGVPIYNTAITFHAGRWIGTKGAYPWTLDVDLYPKLDKCVKYDICMTSGGETVGKEIKGYSYIMIFGELGETGKYPVEKLKEKYDNSFTIEAFDVGKIYNVRIGHEVGCDVPRWHLIDLHISIPENGTAFNFSANRWIGSSGGSCTLDVDLSPSEEGDDIQYKIYMKTGNIPKTGPNLNIYMNIFGEDRETGKLAIPELKGRCDNHFTLQATDVGEVTKIRIGHESNQKVTNWHLSELSFDISAHGSKLSFQANRQLGIKNGKGTLDVDLYPKEKALGNEVNYGVCVKTCDVPSESSDANAYIVLYGNKGDTGKLPLHTLRKNTDNLFKMGAIDVGKITHIRIGHETHACFKSWFLQGVSVNIPTRNTKLYFPASHYLGTEGDDWLLDVDLFPERVISEEIIEEFVEPPVLFEEYKLKYEVHLITTDVPDVEPNSNSDPYIILCGDRGFTGKHLLKGLKANRDNMFNLETDDVGKLLKIRIGHDVKADRACWHLEEVFIEVPLYGSKVTFPADRWIGTKGYYPWTLDVDLHPKGKKCKLIQYDVSVKTGGLNAGKHIKDGTYIMIFGTCGETGKCPVERLKEQYNNTFTITAIDVGKIKSVRIGHEPGVEIPAWHLIQLWVNSALHEADYFYADRWIGTTGDFCTLDVDLSPEMAVEYVLDLETGSIPEMVDGSNAYINIFGDNGETGKLAISGITGDSTVKTTVTGKDVGSVTKIRVGHENHGGFPNWYLKTVGIFIPIRHTKLIFDANCDLGGDGTLDVDLFPNDSGIKTLHYDVCVKTGDVPDEDNDANAYITLFGPTVDTGKIPLKRLKSCFDNKFRIKAVYPISYIRIGHENNAEFTSWNLQEVSIWNTDDDTKPYLNFPANQNLGTKGDNCTLDLELFPKKEGYAGELLVEEFIESPISSDRLQDSKVEYEIHLVTGDVPDTNSNSSTYIILYGERGSTGKLVLKKLKEKKDNMFKLVAEDIGKMTKIRVGHDVKADRTCWHLDNVFIEVPLYNTKVTFDADRWIGTKGSFPWTHDVDLYPSDKVQNVKYDVCLKTGGDKAGKHVKEKAYIILFGDEGETGKFPIERVKQNGNNSFTFDTIDVGKLNNIRIGHEPGSEVERWHLIELNLSIPGHGTFNIPADRWIGTNGGPCTLDVDLSPALEGQNIQYNFYLKTEDIPEGGSELNAYVDICGEERQTGKLALPQLNGNQENNFTINAIDVGAITKIRIGHEGIRCWYLSEVSMDIPTHGAKVAFQGNRRLGTKDGRGTLDVNLYPKEKVFNNGLNYEVGVKTGVVPDDGCDANAYIELFGTKGDTGKFPLETLRKNYDNLFKFDAIDIGRISHIRIGHEDNADFTSWYLSDVSVNIPDQGSKICFRGGQYLGTKGDACIRDAELFPEIVEEEVIEEFTEPPAYFTDYKVQYVVHLVTGLGSNSKVDSNAYIILYGERGFTGKYPLKRLKENHDNLLNLEAEDVGKLIKIRVGHDVCADRSCWYLHEVYIEIPLYGSKVCFPVNRWIGTKGDNPWTLNVDLYPKRKVKSIKYEVNVQTGGRNDGKDIDGDIYIMIFGEKGETGKYPVVKMKQKSQNSFNFEALDVGKISSIRIGHEPGRDIDCWYLGGISVTTPIHDQTYNFPADRWIGTKGSFCTLDVDVCPEEEVKVTYMIDIETGSIPDIADDSNAFINIFGEKMQTGKLPLTGIKGDRNNHRSVQAIDVGTIKKIRIGHEINDGIPRWFLKTVQIFVPGHEESLKFSACRYFGGDESLDMFLYPDDEDYRKSICYDIRVMTGDVPDENTKAKAYITLFGRNCDTGKLPLKKVKSCSDNLQKITAVDVGKIFCIRVGHENNADFTSWHLEGVDIRRPDGLKSYFPAVCNLGTKGDDWTLDVDLFPEKAASIPATNEMKVDELCPEGLVSIYKEDDKVWYDIHLGTGVVPAHGDNPYVMLCGEKGKTGKVPMKDIKEREDNVMRLEAADLGTIIRMRVGHDVKANRSCWHLQEAYIEMPKSGSRIKFGANRWIGTKGSYPWTLDADLFPEEKGTTKYEINVRTGGKLHGKHIKGDAYIILCGENGETGKYPIDRLKQNYDNTFTVESIDVGKISKVRIGHESGANIPCWYLAGVIIKVPKEDKSYNFPAIRWIGTKGGSCTLDADIYPREEDTIKYIINLETGEIPDGCIEPNTYIDIFGQKRNTGKLPLKVIKGNDTNCVTVHAIDVGAIRKIRVGHERPRIFTTWYLKTVSIDVPAHGSKLKFPADRQIGGYGTLDVDLYPKEKVTGKEVDYEVCIKTGDVPDEGEHANAYIILFGRKKNTGKLPLKTLKRHSDNYFTIRSIDVGRLSSLRIGHENTSDYAAWHLSDIVITNPARGFRNFFPADRVLGTYGERWTMDVDICPKKEGNIEYEVEMKTGNVPEHVGVNAQPYIILCGKYGETGKLQLGSFKNHYGNVYTIMAPDVGEISAVRIGHENNVGCWHLANVYLNILAQRHELSFQGNVNFGTKYDLTVNEVQLFPKKRDEKVAYDIHIQCRDVPDAGSEAMAYIILFGKKGSTGKIPLRTLRANCDNSFEVEAFNVGKVKRIRIGHEEEADFMNWNLKKVLIKVPQCEMEFNFPSDRWIGTKGINPWTLDADLYPSDRDDVHYDVHVKTGDVPDGHKDANAYLIIFGEKRHTGKLPMTKLEDNHDNRYHMEALDVGRIMKIRIGHNKHADFRSWRLNEVLINITEYDAKLTFAANQDLGTKGENVSLDVDLYPKEKGVKIKYEVIVKTGDVPDSGSNAKAYIIIFGDQGETGKLPLQTFSQNEDNWFALEAIDVGKIYKVRIGHDFTADFSSWQLQLINVYVPLHDSKMSFDANRRLGTKGNLWTLDCDLYPVEDKKVEYQVHINTGMVPDAGRDANAYIILYGHKIHTGKFLLHAFEENTDNVFSFEAVDVGDIDKIRVGHDIRANFETWELMEVFVNVPANNSGFNFFKPIIGKLGTKGANWALDIDLPLKDKVVSLAEGQEYGYFTLNDGMKRAGIQVEFQVIGYHSPIDDGWRLANRDNVEIYKETVVMKLDELDIDICALENGTISGSNYGYALDVSTKECPQKLVINDYGYSEVPGIKFQVVDYHHVMDEDKWRLACINDVVTNLEQVQKTLNDKIWYKCSLTDGSIGGPGHGYEIDYDVKELKHKLMIKIDGSTDESNYITLDIEIPDIQVVNVDAVTDIIDSELLSDVTDVLAGQTTTCDIEGEISAQIDEDVVVVIEATVEESAVDEEKYFKMLEQEDEEKDSDVEFCKQENTVYTISVKTGDFAGAGTDAQVFVTLYGNNGHTGQLMLNYEKTEQQNIFERNHDDTFTVLAPDVGLISKIRIGHDDSGLASGWYLETLQIEVPAREETFKFTAGRWLSKSEADKQIEINLYPSAYHKADETTYVITVKTGDCYGAGTDATVFVQLFGEKGESEIIYLKAPLFSTTSFERCSLDLFIVQATDVGRVGNVRIGHDNEGGFAGWYLDWVNIRAHNYDVKFVADRWLDQFTGDKQLDIQIFPTKQHQTAPTLKEESSDHYAGETKIYDVYVKTGDVMWAGTDAKVYITLHGEKGTTGKIILDKSKTYDKPFERKQIDTFTVEALDIGEITKVRIGHDGTGVGAGWYIEGVMIAVPGTKCSWEFLAKRWLDSSSGDKKLECDIFPSATIKN